MTPSVSQSQTQTLVLAPQLRQGLRLLAMGLPELNREVVREMSENPVIDDVETDFAAPSESVERQGGEDDGRELGDGAVDSLGVAYLEGANRGVADPEAVERRERFFANQTAEEGLEEHLIRQIPVSDIAEKDYPLAEMLIGELDADGYFRGSLRDIAAVAGESEERLRALLRQISALDPPGCGATTLAECLLPQLDTIRDEFLRTRVGELLSRLDDLEFVRRADCEVLAALRMLNPRPGRLFRPSSEKTEYVHAEVRLVPEGDGFRIVVDTQGLPTIHISPRYLKLLEDPETDEQTKAYVRERLASVRALMDAIDHRQETIAAIAQAIFDTQPGFLKEGLSGLRPLTMQQIADKVGVHHTTVSRTVRGKYVETPHGTFELRQFFTSGVETAGGSAASLTAVLLRLKEMVLAEDLAHPLSDDILSRRLKALGYGVARRTVAKYRAHLGIPTAAKRTVRAG